MARPSTTRFNVEIPGNPVSVKDKTKQLGLNPCMSFEPGSPLEVMLGPYLDQSHAPLFGVSVKQLNYLLLGGLALSPEVASNGIHFIMEPKFLTKLFQSLDASGAVFTKMPGDEANAMAQAHYFLAGLIAKLPIEQRLLDIGDVFYDGDPDNAGTDSYFDWLTPRGFILGGGVPGERHELLSQFFLLLQDHHFKGDARRGRNSDTFTDSVVALLAAVEASGRPVADASHETQAAALIAFFMRTRPPTMLVPYVSYPLAELERRMTRTPAERLGPLFEVYWRRAFSLLNTLWPNEVADIITDTAALASSLGVGGLSAGLTIEAIVSLVNTLKDLIVFAVSDTNAERTSEVIRAFKQNDKDKEISAEAKQSLQADPLFVDLQNQLSDIDPSDPASAARLMLEHEHGAGLLNINGKYKTQTDVWIRHSGAKVENVLQGLLIDATSYNTKGVYTEFGPFLGEGVAKAIFAGKLNRDWWKTFGPLVAKQHGQVKHDQIAKRMKATGALYGDEEAMRILEAPMRATMKLLGFTGSDDSSFIKIWRTLHRMAASIEGIPSHCAAAAGLKKRLIEVATMIFKCLENRYECMLATPVTAVRKISEFIIDGPPFNALIELDGHIDRILKDVMDGVWNLARGSYLTNKSGPLVLDESDDDGEAHPKKKAKLAKGENKAWGLAASNHGCSLSADGTTIAFGSQIAIKFGTAPDLTANCIGCFAPSKHQEQRNKWCLHPDECFAAGGLNAHARIDGYADDKCHPMSNEDFGAIDWDTMEPLVKGLKPAHNGGRGRGKGGGHGQGRGAPNNHGKGRGKGGKGGKGGGKGRGKGGGRGGKGGQW